MRTVRDPGQDLCYQAVELCVDRMRYAAIATFVQATSKLVPPGKGIFVLLDDIGPSPGGCFLSVPEHCTAPLSAS